MSVTIYSKPACVQCTATYRAMEARNIDYRIVDISNDSEAYDYVQSLGYRQVPVVVWGEHHWAGFRPDKINAMGH
ncbi:glutaredoxin-like protein NrdH [Bartonella sp. DGB2]|uniref:glutaredoxin-like protein NrdH n=1 Tax=Bartonella sp. DGB2 TaxID=3388426 RepID=UPI00398FE487